MKIVIAKKSFIALILLGLIVVVILTLGLLFIDNKTLELERFEVVSPLKIENLTDIKVIHLSDMHFPKIKVNIDGLVATIKAENADIIAISGDLIDNSANIDKCGVYAFIESIKDIAPIFYVNGNHDIGHKNLSQLYAFFKLNKVTVLANESVNIAVKGKNVTIIGLEDASNYSSKFLDNNPGAKNNYKILLAHRPEKWLNYISSSNSIRANLILCGHAHGGQIRFKKGLFAPNQGFLPQYDAGLFATEDASSTMIVSRGIGNSKFPFRLNNKPHIPIITISI